MPTIRERYGPTALIAGASEGLGAAWAYALAAHGLDLILIARRAEPLAEITHNLTQKFGIHVLPLTIDLAAANATRQIIMATNNQTVDLFIYNAASSYIGPFLATTPPPTSTSQPLTCLPRFPSSNISALGWSGAAAAGLSL